MTPAELGTEFAQLDAISQAEFFKGAITEAATWNNPGQSADLQWSFIGDQLRGDDFSEERRMIMAIAYSMNRKRSKPVPAEPEPIPEPTPEPELIDIMDFMKEN